MLVPLSWLKDFVEIKLPACPDSIGVQKLAEKLSAAGLTVEEWTRDGDDYILDTEITPNRPDWMSVYGTAREIAAATNSRLKTPILKAIPKVKTKLELEYKDDPTLCFRTSRVLIKGVKVKSSPEWLAKRIRQIGLRPINNLVDITNYVLWLYGIPLHTFDYDKIRGHKMVTELSKGGEDFRSLDGLDYKLPPNAIIIKDVGRVIDLLPLKGGENTAISNGTTNVLLHSIVCDPVITRRTSQALGLRSDSSAVTERGVDPNGTTRACLKALELILKVAGGEVASELIETPKEPYPNWKVSVSHEKIESILGIKVSPKQVKDIFESLELQVTQSETKGPIYSVTIPTFRNDLHIAEDLIEEIGRLIGYDNFPKTLPSGPVSVTPVAYARDYDREYAVKNILKGAGYSEIYTYSLVSEEQLIKLGVNPAQALRLDNPVSKEYEYLRPRMIGNLLEAIKLNQPNFAEIKLYELGKHYTGETADKTQEEYWLSGAETGERFYEVKGIVESLLAQMGIVCQISPAEKNNQGHPGRQAIITAQDKFLGFLGEIHPALLAKFGIKGHVTGFTLNYDLLVKLVNPARKYQPPSQYPPIIEDLTLTLPEKTLVGQVTDSIKSASKLIAQVELTSVHDRNFTFRITYQDKTKNLTDKDIEAIRKRLEKIV